MNTNTARSTTRFLPLSAYAVREIEHARRYRDHVIERAAQTASAAPRAVLARSPATLRLVQGCAA